MYSVYVCTHAVWTLTQALPGFTGCVHGSVCVHVRACMRAGFHVYMCVLCAFAHECLYVFVHMCACIFVSVHRCLCTAHN